MPSPSCRWFSLTQDSFHESSTALLTHAVLHPSCLHYACPLLYHSLLASICHPSKLIKTRFLSLMLRMSISCDDCQGKLPCSATQEIKVQRRTDYNRNTGMKPFSSQGIRACVHRAHDRRAYQRPVIFTSLGAFAPRSVSEGCTDSNTPAISPVAASTFAMENTASPFIAAADFTFSLRYSSVERREQEAACCCSMMMGHVVHSLASNRSMLPLQLCPMKKLH